MLKSSPDVPVELPQVGSFGYLRGTAQRAQVIRRNAPDAHGERRCLVKLFDRVAGQWLPARDSSGNTTVPEADLYPTADQAAHAGRPQRRRAARKTRRA